MIRYTLSFHACPFSRFKASLFLSNLLPPNLFMCVFFFSFSSSFPLFLFLCTVICLYISFSLTIPRTLTPIPAPTVLASALLFFVCPFHKSFNLDPSFLPNPSHLQLSTSDHKVFLYFKWLIIIKVRERQGLS